MLLKSINQKLKITMENLSVLAAQHDDDGKLMIITLKKCKKPKPYL